MKISFVIPAFNEEGYLEACLSSILLEKKNAACDVEIVVVNNASNDRTKEVALSFKEVRVIDEPKKGLTHARQAGFVASTGELIANVDADAILPHGWINTVVNEFEKPKLIALSGPIVYHDLPISSNILIRVYYYIGYLSYLFNRFVFQVGSLLQGGNFVARREALIKIGGYNTAFVFYGEDTEIAKRLNKVGPVVFTFALPMYSSGRRLKEEGFVAMGWKYPINYFWTSFFKKPFHTEFMDVRPKHKTQALQTTIQKLHSSLTRIGLACASIVFVIVATGMYVSFLISKFSLTTPAEAKQSNLFMVRKFGPEVMKVRRTLYDIRTDADDK